MNDGSGGRPGQVGRGGAPSGGMGAGGASTEGGTSGSFGHCEGCAGIGDEHAGGHAGADTSGAGSGNVEAGAGGELGEGGAGATAGSPAEGGSDGSQAGAPGDGGEPEVPAEPAAVHVETSVSYQTLEGFGAAVGWFENYLLANPHKAEIYDLVFAELGLDILRLRNRYRGDPEGFDPGAAELVEQATASLGRPPRVLLSSWSPPRALKANDREDCSGETACTLAKDENGFVYEAFADWWAESLAAYASIGVVPEWISIQNEPDFIPPSWEGCKFMASETSDYPGYGIALEHVHARLQELESPPKLLGPETLGLHWNKLDVYGPEMDLDLLDGIAHHLYEGNAWEDPDLYIDPMRSAHLLFPDKPKFQTEFSIPGEDAYVETAWLIHNSLVEEHVAAYLHWDLIWQWGDGLVSLESPGSPATWKTEKGYLVRKTYRSVQHYARFTDPGYVRVAAVSTAAALRSTAFLSPEKDRLVVVLVNTDEVPRRAVITWAGVSAKASAVYRTSESEDFEALGALPADKSVLVTPRSLVTVKLDLAK
ncbi:MAG: hypothetical protein DIU78_003745 [Pseudomonadota bacterium]